MKFGLFTLFDFHPDRQEESYYYTETLNLLELADELGFERLWLGEEHFYAFGICPRPSVYLSAVAQRTQKMRLGTAVTLLPFDDPIRVAEDYAMLDVISNGRVDLGVGRGLIPKHFEGFPIPPDETRARMNEGIDVVLKAWTQETFSHDGEFFNYPELSVSPRPIQQPHPPLWVGTLSPESFERAGNLGQNIMVVPFLSGPFEHVKQQVDRYRSLLVENKHDINAIEDMFVFFLFVNEHHDAALAEAREVAARYMALLAQNIPPPSADMPPEIRQQSEALRNQLESFVDNIEERAVVGTPERCRERVAELQGYFGVKNMSFYLHAGARDFGDARRSLELFASDVLPHFKK